MMPDYMGNDVTNTDRYSQQLSIEKNKKYIAASGARSEAAKAASEASKLEKSSGTGSSINDDIKAKTTKAVAKVKEFRANTMESVAKQQNVSYTSHIEFQTTTNSPS